MQLLERDELLARLLEAVAQARKGQGSLVLVTGEAGIGKTTLVNALRARVERDATVLSGSCDPIQPPRALAPVADMAAAAGGALARQLAADDRNGVIESVLRLVRQPQRRPTILILEDLHWADGSTLDLLRIVGRRLAAQHALVISTYRDHDVGPNHPLRLALGDIPSAVVSELRVPPLSVRAVGELAHGTELDGAELHALTAGNPFFVTEVIAAGSPGVPVSVRDAVLARMRRLSRGAQRVLEAAAVVGQEAESTVVLRIAKQPRAPLEECVNAAMLVPAGDEVVAFRHDLARQAIAESIAPQAVATLHRRALSAVRSISADRAPDRLARHALLAGDSAAVRVLAPLAGDRAAALGAHREAAIHYASAVAVGGGTNARKRAHLLERLAMELFLVDDVSGAVARQRDALKIWRAEGNAAREGDAMTALSQMLWAAGSGDEAVEVAERAVALLERQPTHGAELARAFAAVAQRTLVAATDDQKAASLAERALDLASSSGEEAIAVNALTTLGQLRAYHGDERGFGLMEESIHRAVAAGLQHEAARAYVSQVELSRDTRRYDIADKFGAEASAYLEDRNLDFYRRRLASDLAELALDRGRWAEAAGRATSILDERRTATVVRVRALAVLGRLRARRGDRDVWPVLDEAIELAGNGGDPAGLSLVRVARIESAWLTERPDSALAEAMLALQAPVEVVGDPWLGGEVAFWAWRAGAIDRLPTHSAEPYRLHAAGEYRLAAAAWRALGCPYNEGLALADSQSEGDLRASLALFHDLDALPMGQRVFRRLRELGARHIPRGPRPATRQHTGRLTPRQAEILALLSDGLRNDQIADRLVLSPKTVDNHVSAILRKLRVANRSEAIRLAATGSQNGGRARTS